MKKKIYWKILEVWRAKEEMRLKLYWILWKFHIRRLERENVSINTNVKEKADLIWSIADKLTGVYKPHEYGRVILPLTVIRRFDCVLSETKDKVLEVNKKYVAEIAKLTAEKIDSNNSSRIKFIEKRQAENLMEASGYSFYNVSPFTLKKIVADADNVTANFRNYLNGFSENVRNILEKFKFDVEIERMDTKKILFSVLEEFTAEKSDFYPDKISNIEMGYVFEEIIRRFSRAMQAAELQKFAATFSYTIYLKR